MDRFSDHSIALDSPASDGFAIVPNDSVDLPEVTRAVYVGVSGSIRTVTAGGGELVLDGAVAGTLIPVRVKRVYATGTTAAGLVALV
ncbi:MAG: hypothetical protein JJ902_17500 [Roseibium sp.]|nr:hypothetical protein [Roseibium sp.]